MTHEHQRNKRGERYKLTVVYSNGQHWCETFDRLVDVYEYMRENIQRENVSAMVISHNSKVFQPRGETEESP